MGLFSALFGGAAMERANKRAAQSMDAGYDQARGILEPLNNTAELDAATNTARNQLNSGFTTARGYLNGLNNSTALDTATNTALNTYDQGYARANEALRPLGDNTALDAAQARAEGLVRQGGDATQFRADMQRAEDVYRPYTENAGRDFGYYRDSVGAGDSAAAVARFKGSPEYMLNHERAQEAGNSAVNAQFGASGMGRSGNALKALQDRATEITNGYYGNYKAGLGSLVDREQQASGAVAGIRQNTATGAANMQTGMFNRLADIGIQGQQFRTNRADGLARSTAELAAQHGTGRSGIITDAARFSTTRNDANARSLADMAAREGIAGADFNVNAARYGDARRTGLAGSLADIAMRRGEASAQNNMNRGQIRNARWAGVDSLIGDGLAAWGRFRPTPTLNAQGGMY